MKAMIVEDSKLAALAIKTALNGFGYDDVVMVSDGLEAVKLEKEVEPDLITMDINMPNLNGIEATRQILSRNPTSKIIVITEKNLTDDEVKGLAGVKSIILKPVTKDKISAALAKI